MIHSVSPRVSNGVVFRYSWQKSDSIEPTTRLRAFYKKHPGIVRFVRFPFKYRLWLEKDLRFPNYNWYHDRTEAISSQFDFDAEVWDIDTEVVLHPIREHKSNNPYRQPKLELVRQHFVAPFRKSNEALVLSSDVPLQIVNCESTLVLLDLCQEQGAKLHRDFEFTKRERYIVPKSDDMRLMLTDKIESWPEFNMMFTIEHPHILDYTVTIDDLK